MDSALSEYSPQTGEVLLAHTQEESVLCSPSYQKLYSNIALQIQGTSVSPFGLQNLLTESVITLQEHQAEGLQKSLTLSQE